MKLSKKQFKQLTDNLNAEITPFFSTEELNQLAKESEFVKREFSGKIDGEIFLNLIVFNHENLKQQSLEDLADILKDDGIEITRQALHNRFNENAVKFLASALTKILQQQFESNEVALLESKFKRVLIKDSVCFQIDESLAKYYRGSGGDGSEASIRIQFEYELLRGTITDLSINAFNEQDAKDSLATIEKTREGDLIIRDLAYMSIAVLKKIIGKYAFYLCRPNTGVKMYEKIKGEFVEIDFNKVTKNLKKNKLSVIEKSVYYGAVDKIKTRLIIHLLPEEQLAKRLRKANKNAKKKGRKLSKEYKTRAAINLFITNTSIEKIPTEKVWSIYRLRWQIELMFKIWKSICNIEKVKKVKKERLECYIFSKLIFITLAWKMVWVIAKNLFRFSRNALSFYKAFKALFRRKMSCFQNALQSSKETMLNFMLDFYDHSSTKYLLDKRLKELTSLEIIIACLNKNNGNITI